MSCKSEGGEAVAVGLGLDALQDRGDHIAMAIRRIGDKLQMTHGHLLLHDESRQALAGPSWCLSGLNGQCDAVIKQW